MVVVAKILAILVAPVVVGAEQQGQTVALQVHLAVVAVEQLLLVVAVALEPLIMVRRVVPFRVAPVGMVATHKAAMAALTMAVYLVVVMVAHVMSATAMLALEVAVVDITVEEAALALQIVRALEVAAVAQAILLAVTLAPIQPPAPMRAIAPILTA